MCFFHDVVWLKLEVCFVGFFFFFLEREREGGGGDWGLGQFCELPKCKTDFGL